MDANWGNKDEDSAAVTPHMVTNDLSFQAGENLFAVEGLGTLVTGMDSALAQWRDNVTPAWVELKHDDEDRFTSGGVNNIAMVDEMGDGGDELAITTCRGEIGSTPDYKGEPYSVDCDITVFARYDDVTEGPDTYRHWSVAENESDIETYAWHFPTVLAHEFGHVLRLEEWPGDDGALMYPTIDWGTIRTVTAEEVGAVEFIYEK